MGSMHIVQARTTLGIAFVVRKSTVKPDRLCVAFVYWSGVASVASIIILNADVNCVYDAATTWP